jgi:hypothetical protein
VHNGWTEVYLPLVRRWRQLSSQELLSPKGLAPSSTFMALVGVRAPAGVYAAAAFCLPGQQNQRQAGFVKGLAGKTPAGLVADSAACLRAADILSLHQHRYAIEVASTTPVQGPTSPLLGPRRPQHRPAGNAGGAGPGWPGRRRSFCAGATLPRGDSPPGHPRRGGHPHPGKPCPARQAPCLPPAIQLSAAASC